MTTFCIRNVFLCVIVLPEDGLCRPLHMGEVTVPQQIVINEYICASNWNKHNIICD